ncbi:MAG: PEGA domain-containing protein [Pirellulales bacterium]
MAITASQAGCVQRRLTIRSSPPGALVYVDDHEIGTTPVSTSFLYYGTRKIRLVKDGYETLTVMQQIAMPWYQVPPVDFVSENLVPGEIRDQRTLDFALTPQRIVPAEELRQRAEILRRGSTVVSGPVPPGSLPGPMPAALAPGTSLPPFPPSASTPRPPLIHP